MNSFRKWASSILFFPWVIILLGGCFTAESIATPACQGGFGPYIGKDLPELSRAWVKAIQSTNLETTDVKVQGVGETWTNSCNGKVTQSWGMAYREYQAVILLEDIENTESLGAATRKVYQSLKSLNEADRKDANLSLVFKDGSKVLRRFCDFELGFSLMEQGKTDQEVFEATCH